MKPWKIILIIVSTAMLIAPLTAYATTSMFADVPNDHIFVEDINWMKTAGITNGCGDGTNYCPNDNVTRGQMAAFMHRLATNGAVDAGTLGGMNSSDFVSNPWWISNTKNFLSVAPGAQVTLEAMCLLPHYVISGGGQSSYRQLVMATSRPMTDNRTWRVTWTNTGATTISPTVTVWAMCAGPGMTMIPSP